MKKLLPAFLVVFLMAFTCMRTEDYNLQESVKGTYGISETVDGIEIDWVWNIGEDGESTLSGTYTGMNKTQDSVRISFEGQLEWSVEEGYLVQNLTSIEWEGKPQWLLESLSEQIQTGERRDEIAVSDERRLILGKEETQKIWEKR